MNELVQIGFDYGVLDEDTHIFLRVKAESIRARLKRTAEDIIAIGRDLIDVKKTLGHGQFLEWISDEFEMSDWSARSFMNVAKRLGGELEKISNFPVSVLYELAAPATDKSVIGAVLSGEIEPTPDAIKKANEAVRIAEEKNKELDLQLSLFKQEIEASTEEASRLNELIDYLRKEKEQIAQSKVQTLQEDTPQTKAKLEELEKKLKAAEDQQKKIKDEKDQKDAQLKQKTERVRSLTEEMQKYIALDKQEKHHEQIRTKWRQACDAFHMGINQGTARLVTPIDARQAFEPDDWARLAEVEATLRQALESLGRLRVSVTSQFVESSVMEYVEA